MARESTESGYSNGPKFLKGLQSSGAITNTLQAWYLALNQNSDSFVQIGGYTTDIVKSGYSLIDFKLKKDYFWTVTAPGFGIAKSAEFSETTSKVYQVSQTNFILDTGTSLLYLPNAIYSKMMTLLLKGTAFI